MSKKESSYQKMKRKLAEKEESIRQLRADLRAVILKDGNQMRAINVIRRVQLEKDADDIIWYGDGTRSGHRSAAGIYAMLQRTPEPVNPALNSALNANLPFAINHPNNLREQFEKTVFGMDFSSKDTRDESAIVGWTPDGPMTLSQMQEWIKQNTKEDDTEYPINKRT